MKIGSTLVVHAGITLDHLSPQLCNGHNGQDKAVDSSGVQCLEHLNTYVIVTFFVTLIAFYCCNCACNNTVWLLELQ
jgi:hypothetical protein